MAYLEYTHYSSSLNKETTVTVILPERKGTDNNSKSCKTLYLLHGFYGNHKDWCRLTSIERYVRDLNLAVVMPSADNSFYTNMAYGGNYWDYISEELPNQMEEHFPLSNQKEDRFVLGISMGGYGAFKLALKTPERFGAAVSLSGVLDVKALVERCIIDPQLIEGHGFDNIFRNYEVPDEEDLFALLKKSDAKLPKMRMYCGKDDFLLADNLDFHKALVPGHSDCELMVEDGDHNWNYWNHTVQQSLDWLKLHFDLEDAAAE